MIDKQRKRARKDLLDRLDDLYRKVAENQKQIKEIESTLPLEEQVRVQLKRILRVRFPGSGKPRIKIVRATTKVDKNF